MNMLCQEFNCCEERRGNFDPNTSMNSILCFRIPATTFLASVCQRASTKIFWNYEYRKKINWLMVYHITATISNERTGHYTCFIPSLYPCHFRDSKKERKKQHEWKSRCFLRHYYRRGSQGSRGDGIACRCRTQDCRSEFSESQPEEAPMFQPLSPIVSTLFRYRRTSVASAQAKKELGGELSNVVGEVRLSLHFFQTFLSHPPILCPCQVGETIAFQGVNLPSRDPSIHVPRVGTGNSTPFPLLYTSSLVFYFVVI